VKAAEKSNESDDGELTLRFVEVLNMIGRRMSERKMAAEIERDKSFVHRVIVKLKAEKFLLEDGDISSLGKKFLDKATSKKERQ
jgi:DNA-binding IclR family transcriptional regulator